MLVVAALVLGDVPWTHRLVVGVAWLFPIPAAAVVVSLMIRGLRRHETQPMGPEAAALLDVVASLQSGSPLRSALATLSPAVDRQVTAGAPTGRLAEAVAGSLDELAVEAAAAVRLLDRAGGPAVGVFAQLAAQAAEGVRIRREVRAAVAAPVLQGVVVGGAPVCMLLYLIISGQLGRTFGISSAHAISVSAGAVMTLTGACWVAWIVRKAIP